MRDLDRIGPTNKVGKKTHKDPNAVHARKHVFPFDPTSINQVNTFLSSVQSSMTIPMIIPARGEFWILDPNLCIVGLVSPKAITVNPTKRNFDSLPYETWDKELFSNQSPCRRCNKSSSTRAIHRRKRAQALSMQSKRINAKAYALHFRIALSTLVESEVYSIVVTEGECERDSLRHMISGQREFTS